MIRAVMQSRTVVARDGRPTVRALIVPGVPGKRGQVGPEGGTTLTRTATRALSGHRAITSRGDYPSLAAQNDGELILGVSIGAAALGAPVIIRTAGEMQESSWAWITGRPVFAGASGVLTQTRPVGAWLRQVGVATAPDKMLIDLRPLYRTLT